MFERANVCPFKHRHFKHKTSAAEAHRGKSFSGSQGANENVQLSNPHNLSLQI